MESKENAKTYQSPEIEDWGTVADLTETGATIVGGDLKTGSVLSAGH